MTEPQIGAAQTRAEFQQAITQLRQHAEHWNERPRSPEALLLEGMFRLMDMNNILMHETQASNAKAVAACANHLEACRQTSSEDQYAMRQSLREGHELIGNLHQIDERTVKAKVAEVIAEVRKDIAVSMDSQVRLATLMSKGTLAFRLAMFFIIAGGCGMVFGFLLLRLYLWR